MWWRKSCDRISKELQFDDGGYLNDIRSRHLAPILKEESVSLSTHVMRRLWVAVIAGMLAVGTPLLTHTDSADAIELASGGVVTSARVDRVRATIGDSVAVTVSVKSNATRTALIDVEIYDRSGRKVFQKYWDNRSLAAGRTREFTTRWATAGRAAGPYTVRVGVFGTGWTSLIHWNDQAGSVTLTTVVPTTTASTTATTIAPATTTAPATDDDDSGADHHQSNHHHHHHHHLAAASVVGSVCDVAGGCGVAVGCGVCVAGA